MAPSEARSQVELLHQISNIVSSNLGLERILQEIVGIDCAAATVMGRHAFDTRAQAFDDSIDGSRIAATSGMNLGRTERQGFLQDNREQQGRRSANVSMGRKLVTNNRPTAQ